ncbi:MAG: CDP-glycerol glycerophosphotransferase family protein [Candidatus Limivicinus sp.]|jgi:hypothetical protein
MQLYIDPGTGSMLFTVLVGVLGALVYAFRNLIIKLQFVLSGGKKEKVSETSLPFAIYSDDKRYWSTFGPVCREFEERKQPLTYMTASPDDPALKEQFEYVKCEFIGEGNKGFAKLNMLNADVLLATTPGLDVYQWHRSKGVKYYIHILHAPNDALYRMYGLDYYDAVLLSGDFQGQQIRELEELRGLPAKDMKVVGMPYLDELYRRKKNTPALPEHPTTVLLAPTWGVTGTLSRYGSKFIDALLATGYHIIVRPHPQSFKSEKELITGLMEKYPDSEQLEWDMNSDNFDTLNRSDIMISDFSGVMFDYCLVFNKPLIYAAIPYIKDPYDSYWIKEEMWTDRILPTIGHELKPEDLDSLKEIIDGCLGEQKYRNGIDAARKECWNNIGESAKLTADYMIEKRNELLNSEENKDVIS